MRKITLVVFLLLLALSVIFYAARRMSIIKNSVGHKCFADILPEDASGINLLNQRQYMDLGWLDDKRSNFLSRSARKGDGVFRIAIFGGSFAACGWAGGNLPREDHYSYPALLEDSFSQHGPKNVEGVNFAKHGYG
jgi:hypothetical protein